MCPEPFELALVVTETYTISGVCSYGDIEMPLLLPLDVIRNWEEMKYLLCVKYVKAITLGNISLPATAVFCPSAVQALSTTLYSTYVPLSFNITRVDSTTYTNISMQRLRAVVYTTAEFHITCFTLGTKGNFRFILSFYMLNEAFTRSN